MLVSPVHITVTTFNSLEMVHARVKYTFSLAGAKLQVHNMPLDKEFLPQLSFSNQV